jgi:hypothetical protein
VRSWTSNVIDTTRTITLRSQSTPKGDIYKAMMFDLADSDYTIDGALVDPSVTKDDRDSVKSAITGTEPPKQGVVDFLMDITSTHVQQLRDIAYDKTVRGCIQLVYRLTTIPSLGVVTPLGPVVLPGKTRWLFETSVDGQIFAENACKFTVTAIKDSVESDKVHSLFIAVAFIAPILSGIVAFRMRQYTQGLSLGGFENPSDSTYTRILEKCNDATARMSRSYRNKGHAEYESNWTGIATAMLNMDSRMEYGVY